MILYCKDCGRKYRGPLHVDGCLKCGSSNIIKQQFSDKQWLNWYYSDAEKQKRKEFYDNRNKRR